MKRLLFVGCLILLSSSAMAGPGEVLRNRGAIAGQYIVVLDGNASHLAGQVARGDRGEVLARYRRAVNGFALRMTDAQAAALSRHPHVRYVEQDFTLSILEAAGNWSLDRLDQADLPLDLRYTYTEDGSAVRAYVIDTGVRSSHVEFGPRVLSGFSSVADGLGTEDCGGHGTHVASIIGGALFGVAKGVSIVPVRVLGCNGSGSLSSVIAGLDWIASQHVAGQPAVANMSLGGAASPTLDASVQAVIDSGITFVVAAGNSGIDACDVSPARVPNAITVAATDWTDARPSWSNQGSCVDLFAPGTAVTGAWGTGDTSISRVSGTSMAAPHAAGVAALYLSTNPTASPAAVESMLRTSAAVGKVSNLSPETVNLLLQSNLTGTTGGGGTSGGGEEVQELEDPVYETMGPMEPGIACIPSEIWTCYSIVEP